MIPYKLEDLLEVCFRVSYEKGNFFTPTWIPWPPTYKPSIFSNSTTISIVKVCAKIYFFVWWSLEVGTKRVKTKPWPLQQITLLGMLLACGSDPEFGQLSSKHESFLELIKNEKFFNSMLTWTWTTIYLI